jgi:hypothetical protein
MHAVLPFIVFARGGTAVQDREQQIRPDLKFPYMPYYLLLFHAIGWWNPNPAKMLTVGMMDKFLVRALNHDNHDRCKPQPGEPRPTTQKTESSTATHGLQLTVSLAL